MRDWDPSKYAQFSDLRLRPALDLATAVGTLPEAGAIVDLGCGAGAVGPLLAARFPDRAIHGIEASQTMGDKARQVGAYTIVETGDIATHDFGTGAALLFANASLNWVPDHAVLVPRLASRLASGGWLAVQVPYQHDAPSHALARAVARDLAPQAFPTTQARPYVLTPRAYADLLETLGEARVWTTEYMQTLPPVADGHPVRHFTQATYLRPYLEHFDKDGRRDAYMSAYDAALHAAYPLDPRGRAWFPFRRLFFTLRKG